MLPFFRKSKKKGRKATSDTSSSSSPHLEEETQETPPEMPSETLKEAESAPVSDPSTADSTTDPITDLAVDPEPDPVADSAEKPPLDEENQPLPERTSLFSRLKNRLKRTRSGLTDGLANLIVGRKRLDDELLEEIETRLLLADVGVEATTEVISKLTERLGRRELDSPDLVINTLREELEAILAPCAQPMPISTEKSPTVVLVIGVNGVGKTTTIGKLARRWKDEGHRVMLAAGDTFRAAAVEQLQVWGERHDIPVVAHQSGADSAAVAYEAYEKARSQKVDLLLVDTAGRLHTKSNLMDELKKISRVLQKIDPNAPHETLLVLDGSIGQNALSQAVTFHDAMTITGLCLTKLDGTAKGGILFAIARRLGVPIRYIGVGEQAEDLREFDAHEFVNALFED
jgi:fused signal recognition particle receptor